MYDIFSEQARYGYKGDPTVTRSLSSNYQSPRWPMTKHNLLLSSNGVEVHYAMYLYRILLANFVVMQSSYAGELTGAFCPFSHVPTSTNGLLYNVRGCHRLKLGRKERGGAGGGEVVESQCVQRLLLLNIAT